MEDVEIITLEDGQDYMIVDEIVIDEVKYVYLAKEQDISNFCIRKENIINNSQYLVGLDNKEEFDKALQTFAVKHQN